MGREDLLKKVPLFSELGKRDLERLGKLMVPRSVKSGETIIKENDQAAGFFIVSEGKVEAVRAGERYRLRSGPAVRITTAALLPAESERLAADFDAAIRPSPRTGSARSAGGVLLTAVREDTGTMVTATGSLLSTSTTIPARPGTTTGM